MSAKTEKVTGKDLKIRRLENALANRERRIKVISLQLKETREELNAMKANEQDQAPPIQKKKNESPAIPTTVAEALAVSDKERQQIRREQQKKQALLEKALW